MSSFGFGVVCGAVGMFGVIAGTLYVFIRVAQWRERSERRE